MIETKNLPDATVDIELERLYNLGGYSNTLKIRRKISISVKDLDKIDIINEAIAEVEVKFGQQMSMSRKKIKKLAKEEFEDDGKVLSKKVED